MEITPHQAKYFYLELTRRTALDDMQKLFQSFIETRVDFNPHQVETDSTYLTTNLSVIDFMVSNCWSICRVNRKIVPSMMRENYILSQAFTNVEKLVDAIPEKFFNHQNYNSTEEEEQHSKIQTV